MASAFVDSYHIAVNLFGESRGIGAAVVPSTGAQLGPLLSASIAKLRKMSGKLANRAAVAAGLPAVTESDSNRALSQESAGAKVDTRG